MNTRASFDKLLGLASATYVHRGPVLQAIRSAEEKSELAEFLQWELNQYGASGEAIVQSRLDTLEECGVRGRAGMGFPLGHKLRMFLKDKSSEKLLICNAHAFAASNVKVTHLLSNAPKEIAMSLMVAARLCGAGRVIIALNEDMGSFGTSIKHNWEQVVSLESVAGRSPHGSALMIEVHLIPESFIAGEETALLNSVHSGPLMPQRIRLGPVLAVSPLSSAIVLNIETILQMSYALKVGSAEYQRYGTKQSPGTMLFSVVGDVVRPGLYEVAFGATVESVVFELAGGLQQGYALMAVLPGGLGSKALTRGQLSTRLDYESFALLDNMMGTGDVIVLSDKNTPTAVMSQVANLFRDESCGKCAPCKDGLTRIAAFLTEKSESSNFPGSLLPSMRSASKAGLHILNNFAAPVPLYTDPVDAPDKVAHLCDFIRYRGDCSFSKFAANTISSLDQAFPMRSLEASI